MTQSNKPPPQPVNGKPSTKEDPWHADTGNSQAPQQKPDLLSTTESSSSATTAVHDQDVDEQQHLQQLNQTRHQEEQEAMNRWFRDLDHISVSRTSEKEGFLFKHINYEIESEKLGSKVLRRFSDFYWLWEILLKRYPFRILPNLPPKKLGGSKVKDETSILWR